MAAARDVCHSCTIDEIRLGLTVCQHLLALHGGRLELRGTGGAGTVATFSLPRGNAVGAAQEARHAEPAAVRVDVPAETRGPHAGELTPTRETPPGE